MISLTRIKKPKVRADLPLALRYVLVSGACAAVGTLVIMRLFA
jgi:hypothetical protein